MSWTLPGLKRSRARSLQHLRLWVELLSQCAATTEFRNFAIDELGGYFDHEHEEIRKTASGVFRRIKPAEFRHFIDLATRFVQSRALLDGSFWFPRIAGRSEWSSQRVGFGSSGNTDQ